MGPMGKSQGTMNNPPEKLPLTERFPLQVHPLEPLSILKKKIFKHCRHPLNAVKPLSCNRRQKNLNTESENSLVSDVGIREGCEVVFLLGNNVSSENKSSHNGRMIEKTKPRSCRNIWRRPSWPIGRLC